MKIVPVYVSSIIDACCAINDMPKQIDLQSFEFEQSSHAYTLIPIMI